MISLVLNTPPLLSTSMPLHQLPCIEVLSHHSLNQYHRVSALFLSVLLSLSGNAMTRNSLWNVLEDIQAVKHIVWNGLRRCLAISIIHILNGKDDLQCTVTGDGKSALFTLVWGSGRNAPGWLVNGWVISACDLFT